jgi:hypothetical protein
LIGRLLLLAAVGAIGWYAFVRRRRLPVHIIVVLALAAVAAALLVAPELSTRVANAVGIGRGADLVGYVVDVTTGFVVLHYYTKFVALEAKLTELTRALALRDHGD